MTNFEKIKAMSAVEMVKFFRKTFPVGCNDCMFLEKCVEQGATRNCDKVWQEWLESEVKEK